MTNDPAENHIADASKMVPENGQPGSLGLAAGSALLDPTPITAEWLLSLGFKYVPSSLGDEYADHLELGRLNVWEYNRTGAWLYDEADHIEMRTRGRLRMMAAMLDVSLPNNQVTDAQRSVE